MNSLFSSIGRIFWIVPIAYGGYRAVTSEERNEQLLYGSIAAAGLVGYLSGSGKTDDQNFDNVPVLPGHDEGLVQSITAELSSTLLQNLGFSTGQRCDAMERYFNIPANEFKVVANRFKNINKTTIRNAINNTFFSGCYTTQWDQRVIQRLNELQIP